MAPQGKIPYMAAYGNITKALNGIKTAATPDRFTQDFLDTKLGLKGGSPKPVIPFLKRTGFLGSDGSPSELYKQFRNSSHTGECAARALKTGYSALYEINEYVHDLSDKELQGVIVQATGWDESSQTVSQAVGSFKALRAFADFDTNNLKIDAKEPKQDDDPADTDFNPSDTQMRELRLGYTINLNLPATSDIAVFNAIFKSLREHLL